VNAFPELFKFGTHFPGLMMIKCIPVFFLFLLFHFSFAQNKTPEQFLGYQLGTRFTYHHRILDYLRELESHHPNRLKLLQYGTSNEGRPLMVAFIASPENLAQLERIRINHLKSIKMLDGAPDAKTPPIVWLSYNIHGNEAVSANTSMKMVYELLNKDNRITQDILKNTVIILDPCLNPDGYERYTQWYHRVSNAETNVTPFAIEHDEPWPGGRFNHYLFDLNRDWAWQVQKETRARVALYNQWMPHVHADFHETTADRSYYFPPAAKPFHKDITAWQREFNEIVGENCRRYFDKNSWTYFTRYNYDMFYPSYGDTWPTFNGAIGITFEQGGGGKAGIGIERKNEKDTLTLLNRIDHHYATGMATLEAVAQQQERIVKEFVKFHEDAANAPSGSFKTYVVKSKGQEERVRAFTEWLERQHFQYGVAGKSLSVKGTELSGQVEQSVRIDPNDLLISAYQPKSNLIRILFESKPVLEDSLTYDITSWGVSYLFGLKTFGLKEKLIPVAPSVKPNENSVPAVTPYAYLAHWSDVEDAVFLSGLLKRNILVRTSNVPFEINKTSFAAGTLIITKKGNNARDFDQFVTTLANKHHVKLTPVSTGFVSMGADFGSDYVPILKTPKVVTITGDGITATALGAVWHFFEQQIGYPMTLVDARKLAELPWNEIDVLILPDGKYTEIITERVMDQLQEWIRNGGKLIAMENATSVFVNKPGFSLLKKSHERNRENSDPLKKFGDKERAETSESLPGSMFGITLDTTHPLAFGCNKDYFTLVRNAYDMGFLKDGWNVGYVRESGYKAGFVGSKLIDKLKNTLIMGVQDIGKGHVVYLLDDPLFRGMLYDGQILFSNAVFR
jgi:hypothetical protein